MRIPRKPLAMVGALALACSLSLTACTSTDASTASNAGAADSVTSALTATYVSITDLTELAYDELGLADFEVETTGAHTVTLADDATKAFEGVTVAGDVVTITAGGVYRLTGTLSAGRVVIDAGEDDVTVILDGVDITAPGVGALVVANADDVQIVLEAGSRSVLADATGATVSTEADATNATLYSTADLWIGGTGSLTVNGVADGISSKDSLVIDSGTYVVTTGDDGIRGKDHLVVLDGDLTVNAGGDGLKSDNESGGTDASATEGVIWIADGTFDITAADDGIQGYRQVTILDGAISVAATDDGVHSEGVLRIAGGRVTVSTSYEGLESAVMLVSGGDIDLTSSDDGINVAGGPGVAGGGGGMAAGAGGAGTGGGPGQSGTDGGRPARPGDPATTDTTTTDTTTTDTATTDTAAAGAVAAPGGMDSGADSGRYLDISGGSIVVNADGDGIDVGGVFTMSDGVVVVSGPTNNGNGALDVDGAFTVTGGSLVAGGSSGMAMTPTSQGQGTLSATFQSTVAAGTRITVLDADGQIVASYVAPKPIQSLVVTTGDIAAGDTYSLVSAGAVTGGTPAGPASFGGVLSGADTNSMGSLAAS